MVVCLFLKTFMLSKLPAEKNGETRIYIWEQVGLEFASELIIDLKIDSICKWKEVTLKTVIYLPVFPRLCLLSPRCAVACTVGRLPMLSLNKELMHSPPGFSCPSLTLTRMKSLTARKDYMSSLKPSCGGANCKKNTRL